MLAYLTPSPSTRWLAVLGVVLPFHISMAQSEAPSPSKGGEQSIPAAKEDSEQARPRRGDRSEAAGRKPGGPMREFSESDIARIIATARDIDSAWADGMEEIRGKDPGLLRQRLGQQARRLIGLSMLREKQPDLYAARVADLRIQRQMRGVMDALQAARTSNDAAAEAAALTQAEVLAGKQVEADIKVRAYEMVAMDQAIKDARVRLQNDIQDRKARIQTMMESMKQGKMPKFGRVGDGLGPAGFGDGGPHSSADESDRTRPESVPATKPSP